MPTSAPVRCFQRQGAAAVVHVNVGQQDPGDAGAAQRFHLGQQPVEVGIRAQGDVDDGDLPAAQEILVGAPEGHVPGIGGGQTAEVLGVLYLGHGLVLLMWRAGVSGELRRGRV